MSQSSAFLIAGVLAILFLGLLIWLDIYGRRRCPMCEGSGKNVHGNKCVICSGAGRI